MIQKKKRYKTYQMRENAIMIGQPHYASKKKIQNALEARIAVGVVSTVNFISKEDLYIVKRVL